MGQGAPEASGAYDLKTNKHLKIKHVSHQNKKDLEGGDENSSKREDNENRVTYDDFKRCYCDLDPEIKKN
jgi:hypothetical protein